MQNAGNRDGDNQARSRALAQNILDRLKATPDDGKYVRVDHNNPILNNAASEAESYGGTTWRSLEELYVILGKDFRNYVESLKKGSYIFLPGGGHGIYGLELGLEGHFVFLVNSQDFYSNGPLGKIPEERELSVYDDVKRQFFTIGSVRINVLNRLAKAFRIPFPREIQKPQIQNTLIPMVEFWKLKPGSGLEEFWNSALEFQDKIMRAISGKTPFRGDGCFVRYGGLAQKFMSRIKDGSLDLIIDVLDAFTYSDIRPFLIADYYAKLSAQRKAFIYLDIEDRVVLKESSISEFGGERRIINLSEYLAKRFPEVFRVIQHKRKVPPTGDNLSGMSIPIKILEVTRRAEGLEQTFFRNIAPCERWVKDRGGSQVYPIVFYEEV